MKANKDHSQNIKKIWTNSAKGYKLMVNKLNHLKKVADYKESANNILVLLEEWKKLEGNWSKDSSAVKKITDQIKLLHGRLTAEKDYFPINFEKMKLFSGTLHCESCLASIFHEGTRGTMVANKYQELLRRTKVDDPFSNLSLL